MNWTTIAPIIPICPGDVVWGPSPEGLKRQVTRGVRGEYIALDDAETCAAFDKRLGERLGVGGEHVEVVKTSKGWSVISERVVTLDHGTDDALVARVLLWAWGGPKLDALPEPVAAEPEVSPPAASEEVALEEEPVPSAPVALEVAMPAPSVPVASEAAPTPSAPAPSAEVGATPSAPTPTKARRSPR